MKTKKSIPADPRVWTYEDARQAAEGFAPSVRTNSIRAFYEGDHWQNGAGWIGPYPAQKSSARPTATLAIEEIRRRFVSQNAIKDVVNRQRNALMARDIEITVTPLAEEIRPALRADAADEERTPAVDMDAHTLKRILDQWIRRDDTSAALDAAVTTMIRSDRASLRFYLPPMAMSENGILRTTMLEDAADLLFIDAPPDGGAGVYTVKTTRQRIAIYIDISLGYAEIAYQDHETKQIVIRQLDKASDDASRYDLGLASLPIYEILQGDQFITDQMISQQKALNLAETLLARNAVAGGFLERTLMNAQVEGEIVRDADGSERYQPPTINWGAGITNIFTGLRTRSQNGQETYTQPELIYHDPVPPDTFIETSNHHYAKILAEAHQLYALIADDATASGKSRITAMSDHIVCVLTTKTVIDRALSWVVEVAASYLELITGEPGRWTGKYKIQAEAVAEFGPIAADMIDATIKAVKAELLSRRAGMAWIGVKDAEAEEAQIVRERRSPLTLQARMGEQLEEIGLTLSRNQQSRSAEEEPSNDGT